VIGCETFVEIASFSEIFQWMMTARRPQQLFRPSDSRYLPADPRTELESKELQEARNNYLARGI
jgi:hypothetical protein